MEAIKICLENNNAEFEGQHYVQTNETAMGPKNSCSYADISMTEVDQVVTSQGPYKPGYWCRFRDDAFDIWTHGAAALFEFTDFLNSIGKNLKWKTNLRFKLKSYSEASIHYLDTKISLTKGKLQVDMFSKPTDAQLYLLPTSNHPKETTRNIPYGVGLRIHRNCSEDTQFETRLTEHKGYFTNRGYNAEHIDKEFNKVRQIQRKNILQKSKRDDVKDAITFICKYDPRLPNIKATIRKNLTLLYSDPQNKLLFPKSCSV